MGDLLNTEFARENRCYLNFYASVCEKTKNMFPQVQLANTIMYSFSFYFRLTVC